MTVPIMTINTARNRLTLTYLAIIMALTLGFSAVFYQQTISEARGNLQRQENQLQDFLFFTTPERVSNIRDAQLETFKKNLLLDLAVLNIGMLVTGFFVSTILARRSLRPLEEMLRTQSRFTSDAAHELRTPLTAMKTEIEVSLRDKKLSKSEAVEVLESNLEEVQKLETLTSALLRLAKSDEKIDKSLWNDYKVIDILNGAKDRVAKKASAKSVNIMLPDTKIQINGDSDQLLELFVTLLDNAVKYSPEKSQIEVAAEKIDNKVLISVIDQGVGITEIDLPHIFDRFYRADQSRNKNKVGGYGLGLSLAKTIAEAHGGKIKVDSKFKKGSTFTVELPS